MECGFWMGVAQTAVGHSLYIQNRFVVNDLFFHFKNTETKNSVNVLLSTIEKFRREANAHQFVIVNKTRCCLLFVKIEQQCFFAICNLQNKTFYVLPAKF